MLCSSEGVASSSDRSLLVCRKQSLYAASRSDCNCATCHASAIVTKALLMNGAALFVRDCKAAVFLVIGEAIALLTCCWHSVSFPWSLSISLWDASVPDSSSVFSSASTKRSVSD